MMRRRKSTGEYDTELQQVFNVFDKNKDGFIDKDELFDMLSRLGELITEVNKQKRTRKKRKKKQKKKSIFYFRMIF